MAMSGLVWSLSQEALIRRQVEAYAADPSAGASKGQSSIQIRRDWKAKEEQLQVGLLSQPCSSVLCSNGRTVESMSPEWLTQVADRPAQMGKCCCFTAAVAQQQHCQHAACVCGC